MNTPSWLKSKKFWAMVGGLVATVAVDLIPGLEALEPHLTEIVAVIGAYIVGTGLADLGKNGGR